MAYVPQQAWIQSATLKENILFGSNLDNMRYGRTIKVCGLGPDIDLLPERDATVIGEEVCSILLVFYEIRYLLSLRASTSVVGRSRE